MAPRVITEITRLDLPNVLEGPAKITKLQQLASYNWLNRSVPTITVPGSPPRWFPPLGPTRLIPDSGMVYIDQNTARNPRFPLESLLRALYTENPDFQICDIDLITDRNNIRKLLRFAQGSSREPFQIQVEIVGKTALLIRLEDKATDFIVGFKGYGHNFERAYTKNEHGCTSYHRIIGYDFGGMRCIVRHETDGYVCDTASMNVSDNLSGALKSLSISKAATATSNGDTLIVETDGKAVNAASLLEIKTRAITRRIDMNDVYPQLWISQTPKLVIAYHERGTFGIAQPQDVTNGIRLWEATNQNDLRRLACLLAKIVDVVKGIDSKKAIVKYDGGVGLKVVMGDGKPALPDDLYLKWKRGELDVASLKR